MARATTTSRRENPCSFFQMLDFGFAGNGVDGDRINIFLIFVINGLKTDGSSAGVAPRIKKDHEYSFGQGLVRPLVVHDLDRFINRFFASQYWFLSISTLKMNNVFLDMASLRVNWIAEEICRTSDCSLIRSSVDTTKGSVNPAIRPIITKTRIISRSVKPLGSLLISLFKVLPADDVQIGFFTSFSFISTIRYQVIAPSFLSRRLIDV